MANKFQTILNYDALENFSFSPDDELEYTDGSCQWLALSLHNLTGWKVYCIKFFESKRAADFYNEKSENCPFHWFVGQEVNGETIYIDVLGCFSEEQMKKRYCVINPNCGLEKSVIEEFPIDKLEKDVDGDDVDDRSAFTQRTENIARRIVLTLLPVA